MKKMILTTTFILILTTPSFADFTLKDLFISGGTAKPTDSKDNEKKEHICDCYHLRIIK